MKFQVTLLSPLASMIDLKRFPYSWFVAIAEARICFGSVVPAKLHHQFAEEPEKCHVSLLGKLPGGIPIIAMRVPPRPMIAGQEVACPLRHHGGRSNFQSGVLN